MTFLKEIFSRSSLLGQIVRRVGYVFLVSSVLYGWYYGESETRNLYELKRQQQESMSQSLAINITPLLYKKNLSDIEQLLIEYADYPDIVSMKVVDNQGDIQSEVNKSDKGDISPSFFYGNVTTPVKGDIDYKMSGDIAEIWVPLEYINKQIGWLQVSNDHASIDEARKKIWLGVVLYGAGVFLASIFLLSLLLQRTLSPIKALSEHNRDIIGNMGKTIDVTSDASEISELINASNLASQKIHEQANELKDSAVHLEDLVQERTRELYRAKEIAETASNEKSRFLACMSHELRTPLHAVNGFAQIMLVNKDELDKEQRYFVQEILNAGDHLLQMLDELLDVGRIEQGVLEINPERINLSDIISETFNMMKPVADNKNVELSIDEGHTGSYDINVDKKRIKQIVFNLVSNAIKYTKSNGHVVLRTKKNGDKLRLSVIDDGQGIAGKDHKYVFDKFTRFGDMAEVDGVGIGLNLTKQLVHMMHGEIGFYSELNKGSEFWVEFPCVDSK